MNKYKDKRDLDFEEDILNLGVSIHQKGLIPLKIIQKLLRKKKIEVFSLIILRSDYKEFGEFIRGRKRKADYLFCLNEDKQVYAVICQETDAQDGFLFMQRLERELQSLVSYLKIQAGIVSVSNSIYSLEDLIFSTLENYIKAIQKEDNQLIHKTAVR